MLRFELLRDKSILILMPDGALRREDFERLAFEVDPFLLSRGKLAGLMIHAKAFPGWDSFAAFLSHLKFVAGHRRRIERIAVVTDSGFLKVLPRIAEHFVQAKVRHFDFDKKDEALAWLEEGQ